jgi:hypothetical protein
MTTGKFLDVLPISFSHLHVPAHQDISRDEINIWGGANDDCDTDYVGQVHLYRRFGKWHGTNGNTGMRSIITPRISSHKQNQ